MKTNFWKIMLCSLILVFIGCKETNHEHPHNNHKVDGEHKAHMKEGKNKSHKKHHENKECTCQHCGMYVKKESVAKLKEQLTQKGFQIFDYIDEETGDTIVMQEYYIAFLKRGPNRTDNKATADSLQQLHMNHLGRMYKEGYADISGPFGDDGDIRGVTIYNVPNLKMADSLANLDPMVKAGWLKIETHPWWAGKGYPLR